MPLCPRQPRANSPIQPTPAPTWAGVSVSLMGCPSNRNLICLIDKPWKNRNHGGPRLSRPHVWTHDSPSPPPAAFPNAAPAHQTLPAALAVSRWCPRPFCSDSDSYVGTLRREESPSRGRQSLPVHSTHTSRRSSSKGQGIPGGQVRGHRST